MVFVREFVQVGHGFRVFGVQNSFRGTKHLDGFKEDFADMFVHHEFGNFLLDEGENK
jgi:hypothetical protein